MSQLLIVAIDPGSEAHGVVRVEATLLGRSCLSGEHRTTDFTRQDDLLWYSDIVREVRDKAGVLAIEQIEHAYGDKPDGHLIATKDQEAQMVGIARYLGVEPVRMTAVKWRASLGIRPPKADQQIAVAVEHIYGAEVRGMFSAHQRVHVYDALGMAAVVTAHALGQRAVTLDASTVFAIERLRTDEQHARKVKKGVEKAVGAKSKVRGWSDSATVADVGRLCLIDETSAAVALKAIGRGKSAVASAAKGILSRWPKLVKAKAAA